MDTLVEAIQDVVIAEPETESQPDPTQPVDTIIETHLAQEISTLWMENTRLSANRKATAKDLRQIRAILAERLHEMKSLLSRPGRGGQWRSWLKERGINRSTADSLVAELAGLGPEQRAEGLLSFKPAPTAAVELPATAPATDPAPQPSDETPA